jgi:hypothetical protein
MVKSGSWEGFERFSKAASKLETVSLSYRYDLIDSDFPNDLKAFLLALEGKFGGTRYPKGPSGRGDNYLSAVAPAVGIVVSFIVVPLIRKYLDGIFNVDALKELGESHRDAINSWFSELEKELDMIVAITNNLLKEHPEALICRRQRTDLVLRTDLGDIKLSVALTRHHSEEIRAMIPHSIVRALRYLAENHAKGNNLGDFTLRYDHNEKKWFMHVTNVIDFLMQIESQTF